MNADSAAAMASTLLTTAKGAESAAEAVNTTMVASNAAAWYAHPIMWIVAIIIAAVAAIALLTVGLMKMNAEAEAEDLRMEAEAMQKLADESNKTAKANQELINSYNELFAAYKDGADNQEALLEKSLEIAEAYDNEAMKVAALRGEYDKFNRLLVEERKKEIKDTKEDNDAATAATSNQLGHALREGDGHRTGSGGFYQEFDTGAGTADEEFAKNAIKNSGKTYNYLKVQDGAQGDVELNISDLTKPDEVLGAYKEVQEWVDEMNKMAAEDDSIKLGESEMYTEAMDFLSEHKEMYDKAKEYADANKALVIEEQALNTQLSNGDGIYDIDSLKEYTEYKEKYLNDIKNSDEYKNATKEEQETFLKDAEDYLGNFTHLTEFETQETLVGGIADEKEREKIIKWMDTLSDDEYAQVVMKIDKNSTLDGLKSDLEEIQEQLERETFNVKVEAAFEVEELLENGVYNDTLKEAFALAKYEKSLDEIKKDTKLMDEFTKAWAEFITMGREEQKNYFSNQTSEENIWGDQGNEEAFYKDKKRAEEKYQQDTEIYEADLAEYYALHTQALTTREIDNINNELMKYTPDEKIKVRGYYSAAGNFVESEEGGHFQYKPNPYWTGSQEYQDLIEKKRAAAQRFNYTGLYMFTDQEVSDYLKAYDSGDTTDYQPEKSVDGSLEDDDVKLAEARAADEEAYRKALESNIEANGMEIKSVYGLADAYNIMGGAIDGVSEELANDYKWATKVAYINSKIKTGLEELSGSWEVISEQLRSSDPSQQIQGLVNLEKHLSKVFNIPVGTLSEEFLGSVENLELMNLAFSGNKEAFDEFVESVKKEIAGSDTDGVLDGFDQLVEGLKIGDKLDKEQHGKLEEYINSLLSKGRDIEQINSLLKQYGIDFALTEEHIDETSKKIKDGLDLTGAGYTGNPFEQAWENSGLAKKATERDIEELKQLDEEIERYYEINKLLEKNAQKQERLSKIKDSAYGMKKVAAIEAESAALEEQLALQERYMQELQANANKDASNMAYFGATFNDQGVISNYESMVQAQIDKYNAAVETYNNSAQSEYDKSILEAAEKQYDLFQETLSQYDETMDELDSAATEKLEIQNALIDKALEKLQTKIEIKIEVNAMELERLEYVLEKLDDPIEDAVEAMNNLGEQTTQIISKNKEIQSGINELLELSKTRDLTANEVKQLKEWRTQLYENNKALNDIENNLSEYLVNAFEEWNKQMEKSIENLDTLTNKLETYASIIDIVGKDTLGLSSELIIDLAKSKLDTSKTNLETAQIRLKDQKEALEEAQRQLDNATTDEEKEAAQKLIDSIKESIAELENSVNDWWTTSLEDAANVFSKQMEKITEDLSNAFGGAFGSLDDLLTYQERQSKLSSEYLADYEKVYELSKLSRNIEKDIDKTDNVKAQKELAALQNEINEMMNSNEKVSKRDIEYAQKKYDLKLAEIALEEAQNAKSQVRMTRDNEGNWSYTYTADNSKVQDAEQNYEDKLYALQDFAVKSVQDLESTFTSLGKEAIESISSIDQKTAEGKKKAEETKKYYMTLIGNTIKENEKLLKNNQEINAKYNTSLASDFKDTLFKEIYPDYNDFSQVKDEVDTKMTQGLTELGQAFSDWQTEVSNIFDLAEEPVEEFGTETMPDLYENVKNENNKIVGSVESTRKDVNEKFNNIITNLGTWYIKYKEPIDKATEENEEMAESVQTIITNYNTLTTLSANDITLTVKSPTATAVNETLSSIQEKIEAINNVTIKPGYDNSAFKQLNYDLGIVTTVKNGASYGADEDNPHQREYYHTSRGWYSKGDTGLVVETDKDGNVIHASGTAVTYTDSDIEMLEKLQSNYANKGAIGNDPKSQHIGLQFEAEKGIKMYNSSGDETTVNYPSNSYHPNIVATDKARLINGKLCLWIDDAEDAGPNKSDGGKNTKGEQYSWDSIVGSYKYMPIEYLFVNDTPLKDKLQSLDTGGYTGDWGNEGRLAMLHQKEIVLNAYDTENFLRAVEIVREIAGIIDLNAQAASFGLGNINASAVQNHNQTIEQEVTIHAEFPNATNHSEIEEAFNNLINTASQYANRKNR